MITISWRLLALSRTTVLSAAILALFLFVTSDLARADGTATAESPAVFLKSLSEEAVVVLSDRGLSNEQRDTAFRRLMVTGFDVDWIGRFVLGRFWRDASDDQRYEYRLLFEDFLIATFARRLGGYSGETLRVGQVRSLGEKDVIVSSQIIRPEGEPVQVDWRMGRFQENWRILDIMVEGISMAVTQRQEFASVIKNNGGQVEGLLTILREKTGRRSTGKT